MSGDAGADGGARDRMLVMGRVAGAFGIKGWIRITAFTAQSDGLLDYAP